MLFSPAMARAIRDRRKTQTRRVVKFHHSSGYIVEPGGRRRWHRDDPAAVAACPYGGPGDRLLMLSSWATTPDLDDRKPSQITAGSLIWTAFDGPKPNWAGRTRPGRFMPNRLRANCPRSEIAAVRLERLNEISEEDAWAEGMIFTKRDRVVAGSVGPIGGEARPFTRQPEQWAWLEGAGANQSFSTARYAFANLWDSINAKKHPCSSNPLVWVVEFSLLENQGGAV